jgi:hypothetical protein
MMYGQKNIEVIIYSPFLTFSLALPLNGKFDYKHNCTLLVICHSTNNVTEKAEFGTWRDSCKFKFSS